MSARYGSTLVNAKEKQAVVYQIVFAVSGTTALGANLVPDKSGASFRVWAPNANAVNVRLTPSEADPFQTLPLGRDRANRAYWSVDISGVAAGHRYQFEITNRGGDTYNPGGPPLLRVDPCARQVTSSDPTLPALVVDPTTFAFTAPFRTPSFENPIIYH